MAKSLTDQLRAMGCDDDQIARTTMPNGVPLAEYERTATTKRSDAWGPYKSKWEMLYAMDLEDAQRAGTVTAWLYEPMRLRLTDPSRDVNGKAIRPITYTPDFLVYRPSRSKLRLVEVKGRRRTKDINRYKLARDKFPWFEFVMVSRKASRWEVIM